MIIVLALLGAIALEYADEEVSTAVRRLLGSLNTDRLRRARDVEAREPGCTRRSGSLGESRYHCPHRPPNELV